MNFRINRHNNFKFLFLTPTNEAGERLNPRDYDFEIKVRTSDLTELTAGHTLKKGNVAEKWENCYPAGNNTIVVECEGGKLPSGVITATLIMKVSSGSTVTETETTATPGVTLISTPERWSDGSRALEDYLCRTLHRIKHLAGLSDAIDTNAASVANLATEITQDQAARDEAQSSKESLMWEAILKSSVPIEEWVDRDYAGLFIWKQSDGRGYIAHRRYRGGEVKLLASTYPYILTDSTTGFKNNSEHPLSFITDYDATTRLRKIHFGPNGSLNYLFGLNGPSFVNTNSMEYVDFSNFDAQNIEKAEELFRFCGALTTIILTGSKWPNLKSAKKMFSNSITGGLPITKLNLTNVDMSALTSMEGMFEGMNQLVSIDFHYWSDNRDSLINTSNVTTMASMFAYCSSLTRLDNRTWTFNNVSDMTDMFKNCTSLTGLYLRGIGSCASMASQGLDVSACPLTLDSLNSTFKTYIYDRSQFGGCSTFRITFSQSSWALMDDNFRAELTAKGYTITSK